MMISTRDEHDQFDPIKSEALLSDVARGASQRDGGAESGRTTTTSTMHPVQSCSPHESRMYVARYVDGGHAAIGKLESAIAKNDHHAALQATIALKQELRAVQQHAQNAGATDQADAIEALETRALQTLAKLPNLTRAVDDPSTAIELWGPGSAEWRAATGPQSAGRGTIPKLVLGKLERAFGQSFASVQVHADSPVATGKTAVTRNEEIHLESGAVDVATAEGEKVLAHELAHVVQQRNQGTQLGSREELEAEAETAAEQAINGEAVHIALNADAGAAYNFGQGTVMAQAAGRASANGGQGQPLGYQLGLFARWFQNNEGSLPGGGVWTAMGDTYTVDRGPNAGVYTQHPVTRQWRRPGGPWLGTDRTPRPVYQPPMQYPSIHAPGMGPRR